MLLRAACLAERHRSRSNNCSRFNSLRRRISSSSSRVHHLLQGHLRQACHCRHRAHPREGSRPRYMDSARRSSHCEGSHRHRWARRIERSTRRRMVSLHHYEGSHVRRQACRRRDLQVLPGIRRSRRYSSAQSAAALAGTSTHHRAATWEIGAILLTCCLLAARMSAAGEPAGSGRQMEMLAGQASSSAAQAGAAAGHKKMVLLWPGVAPAHRCHCLLLLLACSQLPA